MLIKPTVGRVVHFYPHDPAHIDGFSRLAAAHGQEVDSPAGPPPQPLAAIIAKVHGDRLVNLMVVQPSGFPQGREKILLVQDGDERPKDRSYCCWMPYQLGQAAKTEELEKQLAETPKGSAVVLPKGGTEKPKPTPSSPAPSAPPQPAKAQG